MAQRQAARLLDGSTALRLDAVDARRFHDAAGRPPWQPETTRNRDEVEVGADPQAILGNQPLSGPPGTPAALPAPFLTNVRFTIASFGSMAAIVRFT
jgi:hypothetical protein